MRFQASVLYENSRRYNVIEEKFQKLEYKGLLVFLQWTVDLPSK